MDFVQEYKKTTAHLSAIKQTDTDVVKIDMDLVTKLVDIPFQQQISAFESPVYLSRHDTIVHYIFGRCIGDKFINFTYKHSIIFDIWILLNILGWSLWWFIPYFDQHENSMLIVSAQSYASQILIITTCNLCVMKQIIKSFTFWYLNYNSILWTILYAILSTAPLSTKWLSASGGIIASFIFTVCDSWQTSYRVKILYNLWFPTLYAIIMLYLYFSWYPFNESQNMQFAVGTIYETQVRTVALSACSNVVVFVVKQAFRTIKDRDKTSIIINHITLCWTEKDKDNRLKMSERYEKMMEQQTAKRMRFLMEMNC